MLPTTITAALCRNALRAAPSRFTALRQLSVSAASCAADSSSIVEKRRQWVGLTMDQNWSDKNTKLQRPMSPHLTIYSFPLPAVMSISHRISGVALTAAISTAAISLCFAPLTDYLQMIVAAHPPAAAIYGAKFLLSFPFVYHSVNGVRHLIWDTAVGLDLKTVYANGYFTLAVSTLLAIACAAY